MLDTTTNPTSGEPSPWTEHAVEQLKIMWATGLTCREIAGALGNGISKNATIGKARRLGLEPRDPAVSSSSTNRKIPQTKRGNRPNRLAHGDRRLSQVLRRKAIFAPAPAEPTPAAVSAPPAEPTPYQFLSLTLEQLEHGQCRYPHGEGPFLFCGAPSQENSSYCPRCHSVSYGPFVATPEQIARAAKMRTAKRNHAAANWRAT